MAHSSLGENELLLIIEMCNEGIEKCHAREKEHLDGHNSQAAEWDRRLRERYVQLKDDVLSELASRRRVVSVQNGEGTMDGAANGHHDPKVE